MINQKNYLLKIHVVNKGIGKFQTWVEKKPKTKLIKPTQRDKKRNRAGKETKKIPVQTTET